jgi:hypothetical protein
MSYFNFKPHNPVAPFGCRLVAMAFAFGFASTASLAANSVPNSVPNSAANSPSTWPTPGDYQIDSDTTTTSKATATSLERRQLVDGPTGQIKIVMRDSLPGSKPVTQSYPGSGPNKWCVRSATTAPPADAVAMCGNPGAATGAKNACGWQAVVETWRRVDDRTWERTLKATLAAGAELGGFSPAAAVMGSAQAAAAGNPAAKGVPSMPGMPSAKDMAAAMAPVIAGLEEAIRTGSAEDKAAAKQQLAILKGGTPPDGSGSTTVVSKELWKRIAETCPR